MIDVVLAGQLAAVVAVALEPGAPRHRRVPIRALLLDDGAGDDFFLVMASFAARGLSAADRDMDVDY